MSNPALIYRFFVFFLGSSQSLREDVFQQLIFPRNRSLFSERFHFFPAE